MTALSLSPLSYRSTSSREGDAKPEHTPDVDIAERRKFVGDMIAAGACDSEYGVQMLMSVFPDQF